MDPSNGYRSTGTEQHLSLKVHQSVANAGKASKAIREMWEISSEFLPYEHKTAKILHTVNIYKSNKGNKLGCNRSMKPVGRCRCCTFRNRWHIGKRSMCHKHQRVCYKYLKRNPNKYIFSFSRTLNPGHNVTDVVWTKHQRWKYQVVINTLQKSSASNILN